MSRRRRWVVITVVGVTTAAFAFAATARLFLWPATDAASQVDAVVMFAGGRGERLALAERLMDAGHAANLVIPNGLDPRWPDGNRACAESRTYRVFCPVPDPDTTVGEARAIASLAASEGWRRILAVTSTYQLSRAGLLLARCFDGEVLTAKASPRLGTAAWVRRLVHEWLGWLRIVVIDRDC